MYEKEWNANISRKNEVGSSDDNDEGGGGGGGGREDRYM